MYRIGQAVAAKHDRQYHGFVVGFDTEADGTEWVHVRHLEGGIYFYRPADITAV